MAEFQPAPTYELPIEFNKERPEKSTFSPNWLNWFLQLTAFISSVLGPSGTIEHNALGGLQGGTTDEYYHLTATEHGALFDDQAANTYFAGPASGAAAAPSFRAGVVADIAFTTNNRLMGRSTAGAGVGEQITVGSGLTLAAGTLTSSGSGDVVGPGSATDNAVTRFDGATGKLVQNSAVFVDDSARLIIGNATAVAGDGALIQPLEVHDTGANVGGQAILKWSTGSLGAFLVMGRSRGTTVGSHTVVQNGDALGTITFNGSNGTTFSEVAYIFAHVDGVAAAGDIPGRVSVWTAPDGTVAPVEAVRWDNAQREVLGGIAAVTVGTAGRLQVNGGTTANSTAQVSRFSADASGPSIVVSKSRHATVGSNTIVQSGDILGVINAYGADGTNYDQAAQIVLEVGGTPGAGTDMPGRIRLQVSPDGSATPADALVIEANKNADFAANLDAASYSVAGAAGASGTGTVISAITVVNGIVTAITVA